MRPAAILVGVWMATTALGLGSVSLWEPDEPRFAEATRQMFLRHDFLTPYFNGAPRFEKPILFYWMQAAAFAVLGPTETAARVPAALAGLGCLVFTWLIGRRLMTPRAALAGALVLATTFRFVVFTRQGLTDVPVLFWILAALYCLLRSLEEPGRRRDALFGWAALGMGVLTKGPIAAIPLVILVPYAVLTKRRDVIARLRVVPGLLLAAALALPWYLWMAWRHGAPFVDFAIGYELIARYGYTATPFPSPPRSVAWYLRIYPGDAAPWTLFTLAASGWAAWRFRSLPTATRHSVILLAVWFVSVLVFFSAAHFKAPHYILPAYPAAALLTGLFLDRAFIAGEEVPDWLWRVPFVLTTLVLIALAGIVTLFLHRVFHTPWAGAWMLLPVAVAGAALAISSSCVSARREAAFHALVAALAAASAVLAVCIIPHELQPYQPIRMLGERVAALAGPGDSVGLYGRLGGPGLIFYGRHDIVWLDTHLQASAFLNGAGRRLCVIPRADYEGVRRIHSGPLVVIERGRLFSVRLKRLFESRPDVEERPMLLVTNRPLEPTGAR